MTAPPPYELRTPERIVFGWGVREQLGEIAATLGRRVLLVTGSAALHESGVVDDLQQQLRAAGLDVAHIGRQSGEPTIGDVNRLLAAARDHDPGEDSVLVAVGGGSAIDAAKAVAALLPNGGECLDYLEGVGRGLPLTKRSLPLIAMPTTSGTGSECTKNAVLSGDAGDFKKSMRSPWMIPTVALVDPELTVSLPPGQTAATGMDAITQLVESFVSCRANPFTRALCIDAIPAAMQALPQAYTNPSDREARRTMASAAMWSGIALANSSLGMAHGVAASLGVHVGAAHGLACAVMLPTAIAMNFEVALTDFATLGRRINPAAKDAGDESAARMFAQCIQQLCRELEIPERLSTLGVTETQLPAIVRDSAGNSMNGNPVRIDQQDLLRELKAML